MMVGDNGPEMDGWRLPPRHCGDWQDQNHCRICGVLVSPNIILGSE